MGSLLSRLNREHKLLLFAGEEFALSQPMQCLHFKQGCALHVRLN